VCAPVAGGEIHHIDVQYKRGVYKLEFDATINADHESVYAVVTDYDNLDRLSAALVDSALISSPEDQTKRRRLVMKACVLIFCFKAKMVEKIEEIGKEIILMTIIPEESDFRSGNTEWRLTSINEEQSRIQFKSTEEPDFWIPPLIGPMILKRKLIREAKETLKQIEVLTSEGA